MKVREFITYLKKFEQNGELFFYDNDKGNYLTLKSFEEEPQEKRIADDVTVNFEA